TGTDGYFRMRSGSLVVTKHTASPSGQVSAGGSDVLLAKFTLRASGEDMEVRKLDLYVLNSGAGPMKAFTGNVSVRSEDGNSTYMTISAATGTALYVDDTSTRNDLSTYIQLKSNVDKIIHVYGNVDSSSTADTYQVGVANFYVKRLSSIDFTDLATTRVTANQLSTITTSATVAKNSAFGDTTIGTSSAGSKIGSFVVQGGTSEDARISHIQVDFANADDATSVQNMVLKVGDAQQGILIGTPASSGNAYAVSITIPKSTPVTIDIYADILSTAAGTFQIRIPTDGLLMVGLDTSNSISKPASPLDLQVITIGAKSLQITKESSSPTERILTPAGGVLMGNWKFAAQVKSITMKKITFTLRSGDGDLASAPVENFGMMYLKSGDTLLATSFLVGNNVVFTGFSAKAPAGDSIILSLYGDLTGSGTLIPNSVAVWTITSDSSTDMDTGGTSSASINTSGSDTYFATSTRVLYHNSKPVLAAASNTPSGTKSGSSNQDIFIFTITNTGTRDMRIGGLSVTVTISGGSSSGSVTTFDLYDGTQKIATNNGDNTFLSTNNVTEELEFDATTDLSGYFDNFNISAGASKTLTLKADTSAIRTGLTSGQTATLSTKINGSTGADTTGNAWNMGDLSFYYTPVNESESAVFEVSDSFPVTGGTITY
ncbi:MAG: hypothetical protein Q8Q39_04920, partial [bacterium]|nr:hypothetical protein [bacterium]